jgi:hypothetical protein
MASMFRTPAILAMLLLLAACSASLDAPSTPRSASASAVVAETSEPSDSGEPRTPPSLLPPDGRAWFGMNLDWANQTIPDMEQSLGVTPAVWVQFVRFPLDDGARTNLAGFFEQVGAAKAYGLITLEPHDGLSAVTAEAAAELVSVLDAAWTDHGVATFVRFAHEMNGSWYPWAQQPDAYVQAFRVIADAVHRAPASAMVWAPNEGSGYPFTGGAHEAAPGSPERAALDTNGDGELTGADDPYAPYWPGEDAVDWVGMSLYFWGLDYPWGENEIAPDGRFAALLTGEPTGAHAGEAPIPDFYGTYAEGHDKPMAIIETAALYDPAGDGPDEATVKTAWFDQVFSAGTRDRFGRIGMVNWFEWHKQEPEVGRDIDWRMAGDPTLGRSLLEAAPDGWLAFAPTESAAAGE